MVETVNPGDARIRLFETPALINPQPGARVLVDDPNAAPGNIGMPDLLRAQVATTPVSTAAPSADAELPVYDAGQLRRVKLSTATGQSVNFYLGPFAVAPTVGPRGVPLIAGNTYFNTTDKNTYVWNGQSWQIQGLPQPATLKSYAWYLSSPMVKFPPDGYGGRDDYGELFNLDVTRGDTLSVHVNGAKQTQADFFISLPPGDTAKINLYRAPCANSIVEATVFLAHEVTNTIAPIGIDVRQWVFDDAQTVFPLVDFNGRPVAPDTGGNCLVWYGFYTTDGTHTGRMLNPSADFTIAGTSIKFTTPPGRAANPGGDAFGRIPSTWMQAGVPLISPVILNALHSSSFGPLNQDQEPLGSGVIEGSPGVPVLTSGVSPAYGVVATASAINQLTPVASLPTPGETNRGEFMLLEKDNFGDQLVLCMKNADGAYGWRSIVYAA